MLAGGLFGELLARRLMVARAARMPIPTSLPTDTTRLSLTDGYTGTMPSELGQLTGLTFLKASHLGLTGSLPSELGHATQLGTVLLASSSAWRCEPGGRLQLPIDTQIATTTGGDVHAMRTPRATRRGAHPGRRSS